MVSESHREDTGSSENWRLRFVRWTSTSLVIVITLLGLTGLFPPLTAGLSGALALASLFFACLRKTYLASLTLVMVASAHPLYGFATETAVDRLLMEMTGLTLSFFLSAILLSRVSRFVYPACIAIGGIVLLANHSTLEPGQVQQAMAMLAGGCIVSMVIGAWCSRLEGNLRDKASELEKFKADALNRGHAMELALLSEQRISRQKEEFIASFSHELRTPLNAILGLCEALQEEVYGPLTDMQLRSMETIESSGRHLLELIVDVLDVARIGAGKLSTTLETYGVGELADLVEMQTRDAAAARNVTVEMDVEDRSWTVKTDPRHVQRIIQHLFSNAIKFSHEGGRIGLRVRRDEAGSTLMLTVWDEGIGMSNELIEELAQPLVQGDGGLSRKYDGLGLGLTLSVRLAHLLGTSLCVQSAPNEGASFTLALPIDGPRQVVFYGDLNCPFSYAMNEWLEQAGVSNIVLWRGVEHMPDLDDATSNSPQTQRELDDELQRLRPRALATHVSVKRPACRPNSRLALVTLHRLTLLYPERADYLRGRFFRALWRDGKDINSVDGIKELLGDYLPDSWELSPDVLDELDSNKKLWRDTGYSDVPLLSSKRRNAFHPGLGERGTVTAFLKEEFLAGRCSQLKETARDLTLRLREGHVVR